MPVKVLAWPSVWLAVPVLLRLRLPEIRPVKLLFTEPPSVKVTGEPEFVTAPPAEEMSARPPMVAVLPCSSMEVPLPTAIRFETAPSPVALPTRTSPAVTLKPPEKVFAPFKRSVASPFLVQPPLPETVPLSVRSVSVVSRRAVLLVAKLPAKVIVPVSTESPRVKSPPSVTLLANERAAEPTLLSLPFVSVSVLVPKTPSSPARSTPAVRLVEPP